MTLWYFEPRDPFVVRDGRPNQGRSESSVLSFPYPSTVAGLVRSWLGSDDQGIFVLGGYLDDLRCVEVRGPLLSRPETGDLYVPAPRDWLAVEHDGRTISRALRPLRDVPDGALYDTLETELVGLGEHETVSGKPPRELGAWWPWRHLETWLCHQEDLDLDELFDSGVPALPREDRIHVKVGVTETAEEGMLFGTAGLRFQTGCSEHARLAIAVDVGECSIQGVQRTLRSALVPAGGERRLCRWVDATEKELPSMPEAVEQHVARAEHDVMVRIVLLTPAVFDEGWKPGSGAGQLLEDRGRVRVELVAARVPRPETISGWDFEKRRPKKSRRLVSAGSVYWLKLSGGPRDRVAWTQGIWMQNVSDEAQDRNDGFGLAVVGVAP